MSANWLDFGGGTYALLGGSNIGIITHEGRAIMVDAGLDRSVSKKALRQIEALGARLEALIITHGHADHFGGAGWISKRGIPIYAPALEGVFATHPLLEPLFLYGGAAPIRELQGKFTLAQESAPHIEALTPGALALAGLALDLIPLPGHAPAQGGVAYGDVLYCGDVVFPEETLARHPILFCADLDAWL
ncbi:MAG: MBL fold metallo-hydrolase, partial [Anaerolineae bacterium]|nr:MBL fold metallo-hydrolase [Anaerolineae bacterium]